MHTEDSREAVPLTKAKTFGTNYDSLRIVVVSDAVLPGMTAMTAPA